MILQNCFTNHLLPWPQPKIEKYPTFFCIVFSIQCIFYLDFANITITKTINHTDCSIVDVKKVNIFSWNISLTRFSVHYFNMIIINIIQLNAKQNKYPFFLLKWNKNSIILEQFKFIQKINSLFISLKTSKCYTIIIIETRYLVNC